MRVATASVEQSMRPLAKLLTGSQHLTALRDGFQLAMPFIVVGCLFVPFIFPPLTPDDGGLAAKWYQLALAWQPVLLPPYQVTLGLMGLIVAFGTGASLAKQYGMPERLSGLTGSMAFMLLAGFYAEGQGDLRYLGGAGLFTALIASIYAVEVIRFFYDRGWHIKLPEEVPIMTINAFKLLLPLMFIMLSISIFNYQLETRLGVVFPQWIETIFQPLLLASDSLGAVLLSILVCQLLWFVGIHGALLVTGIMNPFWMSNLLNNQAAMSAGADVLPHVYLPGFWDFFILIGGVGSTLPLVFLAMRSRSKQLKSVGKVGLLPSLFNINEPILFGFPIIMNPLFLVPFVLVPMINATIAWFLMSAQVLDRIVVMLPWSMPAPIGAFLSANGSAMNALMVVLAMVNAYFLYLPFFRAHENTLIKQEAWRTRGGG